MIKSTQNRILELDALRGIAAISVVLFHYTMGGSFSFKPGGTGVDLFFLISGFVITLTLSRTKSWQDFIVNRFSRLFPTYWTVVTLTAIITIANGTSISLGRYFANLTMFQQYFKVDDIDWTYWTMMVEMIFYAIMVLLFITKTIRYTEYFGLVFLMLICIFNSAFVTNNYPTYHREIIFWFPLMVYFPLFFAGIIFYTIQFDKPTIFRYFIILLCFIIEIWIFKLENRRVFTLTKMEYSIILTVWFALFILYVNNWLGFLVNRVTLFLGNISFSLYLLHEYLGLYILKPFFENTLHFPYWISNCIAIAIVCGFAYIIMVFIEKPSMNYIRKKYNMYK